MFIENTKSNSLRHLATMIFAFVLFGFSTIYWSFLSSVDSKVVLFYRCLWSFLSLIPCVIIQGRRAHIFKALQKYWPLFLLTAACLATNWGLFIYAVKKRYVFEASLAYFIAPLISIGLSALFLKEKLNRRQLLAVGIAFSALTFLLVSKGMFPKYAFFIGASFSVYGILGRKIHCLSTVRMLWETLFITVAFMFFIQSPFVIFQDFFTFNLQEKWFLIFSGAITVLPMILFISSVSYIKFSIAGILNFIIPTLSFLASIFYFHEKIDREKLITLLFIWLAVCIYIIDLVGALKKESKAAKKGISIVD